MNFILVAILNNDPDRDTFGLGRMSPQIRERLLILAAIGLVVVSAMGWAAFIRRRPRHKHRHIKPDRFSVISLVKQRWTEFGATALRRGERKRIRHRPLNPTRAEVGGLPPARDGTTPGDQPPGADSHY